MKKKKIPLTKEENKIHCEQKFCHIYAKKDLVQMNTIKNILQNIEELLMIFLI